jgi:hypothetical protein
VIDEFDLSKLYDMSTPGEYRVTFSCKLPIKNLGDTSVIISGTSTATGPFSFTGKGYQPAPLLHSTHTLHQVAT